MEEHKEEVETKTKGADTEKKSTRIQTAEGWKRSAEKKMKDKKEK